MNKAQFIGAVVVLVSCIIAGSILFCIFHSVRFEYGGHWTNQTVWDDADALCGDDLLLSKMGSCGHIQVYCEKYWFPLHCWTNCGATEDRTFCKLMI